MARYGMTTTISGSYDDVKARVTAALQDQGFGILSEINVQQALRDKIGVEVERYEILGACNPTLAHQALETDRALGLLLPCNVVLRRVNGEIEVSIVDPKVMFEVADEEVRNALAALAQDARERLERALEALSG